MTDLNTYLEMVSEHIVARGGHPMINSAEDQVVTVGWEAGYSPDETAAKIMSDRRNAARGC